MYILCLSKGVEAIKRAVDEGQLPTNARLGFIPTAGDAYENPYFVQESRTRLEMLGFELVELDLTNEASYRLSEKLGSVDGVYVAGGNTFYLLDQLHKKQLYGPLINRVKSGLLYFGESAGAVLLCQSIEPAKAIDDPAKAPDLAGYSGLGLIDFFPLPHVDREKYKDAFDTFRQEYKSMIKIVECRDDQAILTRDGITYEILDSPISSIS